jgi:pimeloyl-ACP methyl ester carboxylesterase
LAGAYAGLGVKETDLRLPDGRTLHFYDAGGADRSLTVFYHHGTPNIGEPPRPLFGDAKRLGMRWVGYDRPGYGGSTPNPGRNVASAADDVAHIADALRIERFAVMGHSGGTMHALACSAVLPDRVAGAVCISSLAPFNAARLDWFEGMAAAGEAELRAAAAGREALAAHLASSEFDPELFTPADHAALKTDWSWLLDVVRPALKNGPGPMIDDDVALVSPWGYSPEQATSPVLFLHGEQDRIAPVAHARWLARHVPGAKLRLRPDDGHISVLRSAPAALEWLHENATR